MARPGSAEHEEPKVDELDLSDEEPTSRADVDVERVEFVLQGPLGLRFGYRGRVTRLAWAIVGLAALAMITLGFLLGAESSLFSGR